jgi:FkbM family methyltransferase
MASATLSFKRAAYTTVRRAVQCACRLIPDKIAVMVHQGTDLVRRLDFSERPVLLHAESDVELRVRLRSVAKEPEMLPWLRQALKPGDTFYDIGANVGAYTLLAAALHDGNVEVIAFEPGATNYAQLCRNIALNPWARRITPIPIALSSRREFVRFAYSDLTAGAALHTVGSASPADDGYVQKIIGMALDDLVTEYGLPQPNAIKIDVDGAESAVIGGAVITLRSTSLRSLLIELEDGTAETREIERQIAAAGLRQAAKHRCVPDAAEGSALARFHNFVFMRP